MGYQDLGLPFERGNTYCDGGVLTPTSTIGEHLLGKIFRTTDSSGRDLYLRCVRADAALTDVGGKTVSFTSGKVGRNVDALCDTTGEVSAICDDAMATTKDITQYDIFYVVEKGNVVAKAETDLDAGDAVMAHASDTVAQATAGNFVIGIANEADGATTSGYASIYVCGGLKPSDPAS